MGLLRHHSIEHRLGRGNHGRGGTRGRHGQHGMHRPKTSHHPPPGHRHVPTKGGKVRALKGGVTAILKLIAAKLGVSLG